MYTKIARAMQTQVHVQDGLNSTCIDEILKVLFDFAEWR